MTKKSDKMRDALREILNRAMDHPCFDENAFAERNYGYLQEVGGDICDWTMIAITAADALK